jgi:hypothetical protein
MADISLSITGGDRIRGQLERLAGKLGRGGVVNVGFLAGATYPVDATKPDTSGLSVAQVAFWNEFGTTRAPPRPFFRRMIAAQSPQWGAQLGKIAKASGYDSKRTLDLMGENIKGELVKSIVDFTTPALSPNTIRRKGFDKPLIDTGVMQRAVDHEVKT